MVLIDISNWLMFIQILIHVNCEVVKIIFFLLHVRKWKLPPGEWQSLGRSQVYLALNSVSFTPGFCLLIELDCSFLFNPPVWARSLISLCFSAFSIGKLGMLFVFYVN